MTDPVLAATVILGREAEAGFEVLVMQRPARGSFANAWVFPGGRIDDDDAPGEDDQTRASVGAVREVHEEVGLIVDPEALVPLSRWIPPVELKRRFDTHFFLAMAPEGDVVPSPDEVVDWKWST
ncbi:NUDIX domain-containing protein, partial [Agrococcus casei]